MKYAKKIDTYLRMKILHPKLDGIIAISRFLYDYYRSKHCNVVEIPPLIDAEESKWNNSFCFHEGRYELVYAGTPFALKKVSLAKDRLDRIIDRKSTRLNSSH